MRNAIKLIFLTVPSSILYIAAHVVTFFAVLSAFKVHMPYLLDVPFLGAMQTSQKTAGLVAVAMSIVAFLSKPVNFMEDLETGASDLIATLTMVLAVYVLMPILIFVGLMMIPILALKLYTGETIVLLPVLGLLMLFGQALINVCISDLK